MSTQQLYNQSQSAQHQPVKAFPLHVHGTSQNRREPSPSTLKDSKTSSAPSKKSVVPNASELPESIEEAQMRRSKSSSIMKKTDQQTQGQQQQQISKGLSLSKNPQDSILNSLQNILSNQLLQSAASSTSASGHKRTQSSTLSNNNNLNSLGIGNSHSPNMPHNNYSTAQKSANTSNKQSSTTSQKNLLANGYNSAILFDQNSRQPFHSINHSKLPSTMINQADSLEASAILKNLNGKSAPKQQQQAQSILNNNSGLGVAFNPTKSSLIRHSNNYDDTQLNPAANGPNDKLPRLESLILQQQQLLASVTNAKGYSKTKQQLALELLKEQQQQQQMQDVQKNSFLLGGYKHQNQGTPQQRPNSKTRQMSNEQSNQLPLGGSGIFAHSGPKININLQIKNLNIIQPIQNSSTTNLTKNQQTNAYQTNVNHVRDDVSPQQYSDNNSQMNAKKSPTLNSRQQQIRSVDAQASTNPSRVQMQQDRTPLAESRGFHSNASAHNFMGALRMSGTNSGQNAQQLSQNFMSNGPIQMSMSALQSRTGSRQQSARRRPNSKDAADQRDLEQPESAKQSSNHQMDFSSKFANPLLGRSASNFMLPSHGLTISSSIENSRRSSQKSIRGQPVSSSIDTAASTAAAAAATTQKRMMSSQQIKPLVSSYAVRSRPGALPGKPVKTNQDSYIILPNFCRSKSSYFFSVCDGHGQNGHLASQFVKKILGPNIEGFLRQAEGQGDLNSEITAQAMTSGFLKTAANLLESGIDVTFSGSTCVGVYVTPQKYVCSNIGDSRAIVGRFDSVKNQWSNQPLSIDHKPDLPGEQARIIASGGRVDPFKDQDGNPLGPARVWMRNENIPGLAMARSFGDYVASQVGVIQEPEVLEFNTSFNDKFLAIASDGIWEFLSNEDIVAMVAPFYAKNDPDGACERLVREATAAWKREDEVIDDITVIIVFLNK